MAVPCRHFAKGFCQLGAACGFSHDPPTGCSGGKGSATHIGKGPLKRPTPNNWTANGNDGAKRPAQSLAAPPRVQQAPVVDDGSPNVPMITKTRLCTYFSSGQCPRQGLCTFAHGEHEIGTRYRGQSLGRLIQQSPHVSAGHLAQPAAEEAAVWKPIFGKVFLKTRLCTNYTQQGRCPNGGGCSFAHGEDEIGTPQPESQQSQATRTVESPTTGRSADARQMFNFKTSLCRHFQQQGTCVRGTTCNFAHGDTELFVQGEAQAKGLLATDAHLAQQQVQGGHHPSDNQHLSELAQVMGLDPAQFSENQTFRDDGAALDENAVWDEIAGW